VGARWCSGTGRPPKERHFCPCIIFSAFNFFVGCCFTDSTYRPIVRLRSSVCFQLVSPTLNPNIRTVWTWNPCSPYTLVTLVAPAFLIFINILATILQFQSRHNSRTGHCYVMSFAACKRLDVIITIMKIVILCNVMFRVPRYAKGRSPKFYPTFKTVTPPLPG